MRVDGQIALTRESPILEKHEEMFVCLFIYICPLQIGGPKQKELLYTSQFFPPASQIALKSLDRNEQVQNKLRPLVAGSTPVEGADQDIAGVTDTI